MATVFPNGGRALVEAMCAKFPDLHVNEDEKQRQLTQRINEQMKYQFGQGWGGKVRAGLDPVQFRSKDSQAFLESDGTISVWDLFQGAEGAPILVQDGDAPTHPNLSSSDHKFIDVIARDWLDGAVEPIPDPGEPPPNPGTDLEPRVAALEAENVAQQQQLDGLAAVVSALVARVNALEAELAKPLKVVGKTESTWGHQHMVRLDVGR
jgi:uncharacterized coiled-coil protein SlyX